MNKTDFTSELKELMATMSEEEIEKTIRALADCRDTVYRKSAREKSKKAELLLTLDRHDSTLDYTEKKGKGGKLFVRGASLLSLKDYRTLYEKLPKISGVFWLYDNHRAPDPSRPDAKTSAGVRPVIVLDRIEGDLKPGALFYINEEKFKLLTPFLAIRVTSLRDTCTFNADSYAFSLVKFCVDGWYANLIRKNEMRRESGESET